MSRAISPSLARFSILMLALLASMGIVASIGTPSAAAAKPCWERVIDDWIDNGRIDARYSPACLQASLQHVPEDVRAYSDFEEKVKQAIQSSLRFPQGSGGGSGGDTPGVTPGASPKATPAQPSQVERIKNEEQQAAAPSDEGPIEKAFGYGNEDASSIPLPLMILAAFALLLMAAGAAGLAQRKLAARKIRS